MTEIVVSHLTRMKHPRICVAGISEDSGDHLRPITIARDPLTRALLGEEGGPLGLGARIDLGETTADPNPPESEDHWCETTNLKAVGSLGAEEYLALLEAISAPDLATAFGPALQRQGRSYAVTAGEGTHSLACVRASPVERLALNYGPRLRDRDGALIPVTDLRFFDPDQKTPRIELVAEINQRLEDGVPAYLMLGLARAWKKPGDDRSRPWLQLNGICLADRPLDNTP